MVSTCLWSGGSCRLTVLTVTASASWCRQALAWLLRFPLWFSFPQFCEPDCCMLYSPSALLCSGKQAKQIRSQNCTSNCELHFWHVAIWYSLSRRLKCYVSHRLYLQTSSQYKAVTAYPHTKIIYLSVSWLTTFKDFFFNSSFNCSSYFGSVLCIFYHVTTVCLTVTADQKCE